MSEPCGRAKCEKPSGAQHAPSRPIIETGSRRSRGYPIVLTADRTLFADYRILLEGMMSASQTSVVPPSVMKWILARPVRKNGVNALQAPLGLRRIEAALLADGVPEGDIAVTPPERLGRAVGPDTRVIGVSSGDPLGIGMSSTTMAGVAGGEIYVGRWFRRLMQKISRLRRSAPEAKAVMGGAGAWQIAEDEKARKDLGIDHVITGYCEGNVSDVFTRLRAGESLPTLISGQSDLAENIPAVCGATLMGGVEISRGCGLGCDFCTLSHVPMQHLPIDSIFADVATNVSAGVRNITLVTEDAFRYGAQGRQVEPVALISLLRELRSLCRLKMIQTDHANIITLAQIRDEELREIRRLMTGEEFPDGLVWLNLGVETASAELLMRNGGQGKMGGLKNGEWADVCREQVRRLAGLGYFPLVSLIMGLPGETESDIEASLRWVCDLGNVRAAVFPVFHAPLDVGQKGFGVRDMKDLHWRLFRACYRLNFRHMPRLFWDNQKRGGVSLLKRLLMQAMGRAQVWWWRSLFVLRSGKLFS